MMDLSSTAALAAPWTSQAAAMRFKWLNRAASGCRPLTSPAQRHRAASSTATAMAAGDSTPAEAAPARPMTPQEEAEAVSNAVHSMSSSASAAVAAAVAVLLAAGPVLALDMHMEPENALSLPTWAVHTSSVLEWVTAMGLMWRYGEVSGNPRWKGMAWGMLPCLGSAMSACTWHFFFNSPDLQFLVMLQAALTVVGNFTCWFAAYRIYEAAQPQQGV